MEKYISVEDFKRELIDNKSFYPVIIKRALEDMPAANVREVVHGKWIWKDFRYDGSYSLCCSECLETEGARESAKFCPNCGAIMDKE